MIIDARVRPPFKSLKQVLAAAGSRPPVKRSPLVSGYERPPSMVQKSLDLFMEEMDEAGVEKGILVGRQAGHRIVSNDDIAELRNMYPDRFPVAIAGIDGNDEKAAIREVERTIKDMGFKGIAMDPGWSVPPLYVDDKSFILFIRSVLNLAVSCTSPAVLCKDLIFHTLNQHEFNA